MEKISTGYKINDGLETLRLEFSLFANYDVAPLTTDHFYLKQRNDSFAFSRFTSLLDLLTIDFFSILLLFTVDWIPHCAPFYPSCAGNDDWRARLRSILH